MHIRTAIVAALLVSGCSFPKSDAEIEYHAMVDRQLAYLDEQLACTKRRRDAEVKAGIEAAEYWERCDGMRSNDDSIRESVTKDTRTRCFPGGEPCFTGPRYKS